MQNITAQKVMLGLIAFGFFIASPWLTAKALDGDFTPLSILVGVGILILFFFGLKDRSWMIIPLCLPIQGRFNFLPLNFNMQEVASLAVLSYLALQIIFGRQIVFRLGPAVVWVPLAGLLGILCYHWVRSGDIGIRALGGAGWGEKICPNFSYFPYVALTAFLSEYFAEGPAEDSYSLLLWCICRFSA